jgi:hypothetical protein
MRAILAWAFALTLLVLCSTVSTQAADAPPLAAWETCDWGSDDCNVCVPDAVDGIRRLRDHGDILGFHMNGSPDVDLSHHWQGVQRLMSGSGRYLAVSRSLPGESTDVSFVIVEMASRNGEGVRWRSNRLNPDWFVQFTAPPAQDRIAAQVPHQVGSRTWRTGVTTSRGASSGPRKEPNTGRSSSAPRARHGNRSRGGSNEVDHLA